MSTGLLQTLPFDLD